MKTVQDKDGNIIEVADDTPCHAGIDGALPIMLDSVKDAKVFEEITAREAAWSENLVKRNALLKIRRYEAQITERRKREAILGIEQIVKAVDSVSGVDTTWLANQEALIAIERAKVA
jgi:hypothetical protein